MAHCVSQCCALHWCSDGCSQQALAQGFACLLPPNIFTITTTKSKKKNTDHRETLDRINACASFDWHSKSLLLLPLLLLLALNIGLEWRNAELSTAAFAAKWRQTNKQIERQMLAMIWPLISEQEQEKGQRINRRQTSRSTRRVK